MWQEIMLRILDSSLTVTVGGNDFGRQGKESQLSYPPGKNKLPGPQKQHRYGKRPLRGLP